MSPDEVFFSSSMNHKFDESFLQLFYRAVERLVTVRLSISMRKKNIFLFNSFITGEKKTERLEMIFLFVEIEFDSMELFSQGKHTFEFEETIVMTFCITMDSQFSMKLTMFQSSQCTQL